MNEEIKVKGLKELNDFLQQLPAKVERNVLRGALRAGANVIEAEAKTQVPVSPANEENKRLYGDYEGALRDSIRVSVSARGGKVIASVKAGGQVKKGKKKFDVFYAIWVEFGTAAHKIVAAGKHWLFFGGKFAKVVQHPGAKPKPYMRPALQNGAQGALLAAASYIKQRLSTQYGLDASAVDIQVDE